MAFSTPAYAWKWHPMALLSLRLTTTMALASTQRKKGFLTLLSHFTVPQLAENKQSVAKENCALWQKSSKRLKIVFPLFAQNGQVVSSRAA